MASKAFALFLAVSLVVLGAASACEPNSQTYAPSSYGNSPTPTQSSYGNSPTPTPSSYGNNATPTPSSYGMCPRDALKLGVCANVLGIVKVEVGKPPVEPCCPLMAELVDLEAAVCLCTAIKANVLGINLNVPVDLSLILNHCGKKVPTGFEC